MEIFIDFLTNNYFWFLIITIFLIFSLIGYLVESKEQKVMNVSGGFHKEVEKSFEQLAMEAQNKTLGEAVNQTSMNNQILPKSPEIDANQISSIEENNPKVMDMNMPIQNENENSISFEVLGK